MKMKLKADRVQKRISSLLLFLSFLPYAFMPCGVMANPMGGSVMGGAANISGGAGTLNIHQTSDRAIIHWQDFSIQQGELTNFLQPSSSSAVLNRVTGGNPSNILGTLQANGQVFLVNPNGILVGPSGVINTAGFTASTLDVSNSEFMAGGAMRFFGNSNAKVENLGTITATGGDVFLIAKEVSNAGTIKALNGTVGLAGGTDVVLVPAGASGSKLAVAVSSGSGSVSNSGTINAVSAELKAAGGNPYALAINNTGIVKATGVVNQGGRIFLKANAGTVSNVGTLKAKNPNGTGGKVSIESTETFRNAGTVSADGTEGGTVTVATGTFLNENNSTLSANGTQTDGGKVEVSAGWVSYGGTLSADGQQKGGTVSIKADSLYMAGRLSATGQGGSGGKIEVQSKGKTYAYTDSVNDASGATGGSISQQAGGTLMTSATYLADGTAGAGGKIDITAPTVKMLTATASASGETGGGQIRVGGEYQGGKNLAVDELANAQVTMVNDSTTLRADATGKDGAGGTIIVWGDSYTAMMGNISALPGTESGAGGFVEVSSGDKLAYHSVALTGRDGRTGTLLLDPKNITIDTATVNSYAMIMGKGYSGGKNVDVAALAASDLFGSSVSLNAAGNRLAVGAYDDDGSGNSLVGSGAVYLFSFSDTNFTGGTLQGTMGKGYTGGKNVDVGALDSWDQSGFSVSLNAAGDRLAVGSHGDAGSSHSAQDFGAVYLFSFSDTTFTGGTLQATMGKGYSGGKNVDVAALDAGDFFGRSVSLNAAGDRLAVGAYVDAGSGNSVNGSGAVYLFSFSDTSFTGGTLQATLGKGYSGGKNVDVAALDSLDQFGASVSLNAAGDRLAVGAEVDAGSGNSVSGSGAVYLFSFSDTTFAGGMLQGTMGKGYSGGKNVNVAALEASDFFGRSVSLNAAGDRLAVGAFRDDGSGNSATDSGAVYLFSFSDTTFAGGTLQATMGKGYSGGKNVNVSALEASDDYFGFSVSLNAAGDRLAVGACFDDGSGNSWDDSGAVYGFRFTGTFDLVNEALGLGDVSAFATGAASSYTIDPATLTANLNAGTAVTLQANNDITVNQAVTANNAGGNGGVFTLQAGRSILINANITSDNGNVNLYANDTVANGVVNANRDAGNAVITMGAGTTIDAGTGAVTIELLSGAGKTNLTSGSISLRDITAASISVVNSGLTAASNIVLNGTLTASGAGNAIVLSGNNFINNTGASALSAVGGRWLVYSDALATNTQGGLLSGNDAVYSKTYAAYAPGAVTETGKRYLYSSAAPAAAPVTPTTTTTTTTTTTVPVTVANIPVINIGGQPAERGGMGVVNNAGGGSSGGTSGSGTTPRLIEETTGGEARDVGFNFAATLTTGGGTAPGGLSAGVTAGASGSFEIVSGGRALGMSILGGTAGGGTGAGGGAGGTAGSSGQAPVDGTGSAGGQTFFGGSVLGNYAFDNRSFTGEYRNEARSLPFKTLSHASSFELFHDNDGR